MEEEFKKEGTQLYIQRSRQIDADLLDQELHSLIFEKLLSALSVYKLRIQLEMKAILQLLMYYFSFYKHNATYGSEIQNLVYRNEYNSSKFTI
jgi:hypothetical protein